MPDIKMVRSSHASSPSARRNEHLRQRQNNRTRNNYRRRRPQLSLSPCIPSISVAALLLLLLASSSSSSNAEGHYSPFRIVIDAGSTGSRLHIFEIVTTTTISANSNNSDGSNTSEQQQSTDNDSESSRIECQRRGSSKAWTPLSAFGNDLNNNNNNNHQHSKEPLNATHVAHHMLPLFDYASIIIPTEYHSSTPVRIAATAGMRLLPSEVQSSVYGALYEGLSEQVPNGRFTFTDLKRENVMTLNGDREGFYGAVAANYLRGVVDAELKVIVPPEYYDEHNDQAELFGNEDEGLGLCTNKFGMCEQDAENVIFGPSHHYISLHDVRRHGPLGALDMGGSSTQIVYHHTDGGGNRGIRNLDVNGSMDMAEGNDVPSHLNDEEFFSTSYLSYGADQFRERLWDLWVAEAEKSSPKRDNSKHRERSLHVTNKESEHNLPVIFNPCSFVGYQMTYKHFTLLGTGNALLCAEQINRLIPHHDNVIDLEELEHDNLESSISEEDLHQKRKMVGGVEHPPLRGKFYGMSLYFFTLDCLRELSDPDHPIHVSWPTPSIEELTHALDAFCGRKWQGDLEEVQHEAHEHTRAEVLPHRCVEAVYMVTLLRDGFGFHPSSRDITFTQWVEGNEVEWSLGMALSEFAAEKGKQRESNDDVILQQ